MPRTFEATIDIQAPPTAVWRVLSDVAAWPAWLPTVTAVEPLDARELAPGARYLVRQPRLRATTWVVDEVDAPRRFTWSARSPGLQMVARHTVAPTAAGSAITLSFTFAGWIGLVVARLYGRLTASYLEQEAAALKRSVESAR